MSSANLSKRSTASAFAISLTIALSAGAAPAHAGFFDQLFGMQPTPEPQPYAPPAPAYEQPGDFAPAARPVHRARRHLAETKPVRQKTTDLMHDASLRPGDAVMMKDGIHVYEGDSASRHSSDDFVALNEADDLGRTEKAKLAAADTTRNDPLRHGVKPDSIASGRSASVSAPVVQGVKITDASGKIVRYVGP